MCDVYAHRVYTCVYMFVETRISVHDVYVVAYMDTEFTCVCVNVHLYARRVYVRVYKFQ